MRASRWLGPALLILLLGLSACGGVPPAPVDRFYRLQPTPLAAARPALGAVNLQPLRADSLYAERPIIYSESADPRQLRQYHYHLWLYAPAQMVDDHLRASLAGVLDLSGDAAAASRIDGRLLRFERVVGAGGSKAVAALELRLTVAGRVRLAKTYQAEHSAADASIAAFVGAMEQALAEIHGRFVADLAASAGQ